MQYTIICMCSVWVQMIIFYFHILDGYVNYFTMLYIFDDIMTNIYLFTLHVLLVELMSL